MVDNSFRIDYADVRAKNLEGMCDKTTYLFCFPNSIVTLKRIRTLLGIGFTHDFQRNLYANNHKHYFVATL